MTSHGDSFNVRSRPKFDRFNFSLWKLKMKVFLKSLGRNAFLSMEKEFKEFDHVTDHLPENVFKAFEVNAREIYALFVALNNDELSKVLNYKSTFEI